MILHWKRLWACAGYGEKWYLQCGLRNQDRPHWFSLWRVYHTKGWKLEWSEMIFAI